jgi:NADH dehydrogenase
MGNVNAKSILITGGTGVIGRHTARRLSQLGHTVRILSRRRNPDVPLLRDVHNVQFAQGDVREPASLHAAMQGCDVAVLSHQFQNFPVENPKQNETFDAVDRTGTEHCVQAAQAAGVGHIVYISGIALGNPNPPHPGVTAKLAAERAVFNSGISSISLRVNVVYAPDDKYFPKLASAAKWSPFVPVFGKGDSICAPIHVDDVAEAIACAIESDKTGVVSVCGPDEVTWKELLMMVAQAGASGRRMPLHISQSLLNIAGGIGERLPRPLLSRQAVTFATQFNQRCQPPNCDAVFGMTLMSLHEGIAKAFGRKGEGEKV